MEKDIDQKVEDIVGTTTHEDDKSKQGKHIDLVGHDERHDHVIPFWENPLKARDMDRVELVGHSSIGPTNNEEQEGERTSTTTTRPPHDSHRKRIEDLKETLLAMKKEKKILQDTVVQQKGELDDLGGMCAK